MLRTDPVYPVYGVLLIRITEQNLYHTHQFYYFGDAYLSAIQDRPRLISQSEYDAKKTEVMARL
jgi:hypothetical protein